MQQPRLPSLFALACALAMDAFTASGMVLGRRIGAFCGKRVEALGGLVLLGIGIKIVAEHTLG